MADKVENLLASLRGEEPQPQPESREDAPPPMLETGPAAPPVDLGPIEEKIAALEAKIAELEAPPPLEEPSSLEEPPPALEPPPEPPAPPTQLTLFLQTRMELLERKLEMAQRDAVRANMILREREDAQRRAQKEVEDLFRRIREQQRAAVYDQTLRTKYSEARSRIEDLQARLTLSELRMVPAEDVLGYLEREDGRAELEKRLRIQLAKAEAESGRAEAGAEEKNAPPAPPSEAVRSAPIGGDIESIAVLLGRIADLESRLEESEKRRETERQDRIAWEDRMLASLQSSRRQWRKAGGPELLVEASLESMVDSMRERDRLQLDMGKLVSILQDEPSDSRRTPALRARLAEYQEKMKELQEKIGKQMHLVEAWVKRNTGTGE